MNIREAMAVYKAQAAQPEMHCFIKKEGNKHCVKSHSGKNLGCYESAAGAKKRLKQVEYFKNVKADTAYGPNSDMDEPKAQDLE